MLFLYLLLSNFKLHSLKWPEKLSLLTKIEAVLENQIAGASPGNGDLEPASPGLSGGVHVEIHPAVLDGCITSDVSQVVGATSFWCTKRGLRVI